MDRSFSTLPGSEAMHDTWQSLPTSRSDREAPKKNPEGHTLRALLKRVYRPESKPA